MSALSALRSITAKTPILRNQHMSSETPELANERTGFDVFMADNVIHIMESDVQVGQQVSVYQIIQYHIPRDHNFKIRFPHKIYHLLFNS
jgi:hypothetical protein